jgi:hypothetical protein
MRFGTFTIAMPLVMLAALLPTATSAGEEAVPDHRFGHRTAPLLLLSRPDVRADLGLGPNQVSEAGYAISTLQGKAAALKGKSGPEVVKARERIDAEEQHWLKNHLTEVQYARLHQIDLQWEGPSAIISRKAIASRLQLSKSQTEAIARAVARRNHERDSGVVDPGREAHLKHAVVAVFNETQREEWARMLGHPFKLQVAEGPGNPKR